jgi:lipopolysaccharide transport system permease protein
MVSVPTSRHKSPTLRAAGELFLGLADVRVWALLAIDDIQSRYRRTALGPFWLTLSHAAMISGMALVFSAINGQPLDEFFVYIAAGLTLWSFLAASITEGANVFVAGKDLILTQRLPTSVHAFRGMAAQVIVFFHCIIVYALALLFAHNPLNENTWLAIPGMALLIVAAMGWSIPLGLLGARFRDLGPTLASAMGLLFFLTPIIWQRAQLNAPYAHLFDLNPMYHLMEIVRAPLLGVAPTELNWTVSLCVAGAAWIIAIVSYAVWRRQLTYWL